MEQILARLLRIGSAVAAGLLATGLAAMLLGLSRPDPGRLMMAGLLVLIATPVVRVVAALVVFLRERDWLFASFCVVVLASLALGVWAGGAA